MPSSPPPAGSPRDMTAMPQRSEVLHTLFENYMQEVYLMPVLRNKPTLYERLIIRKISQSYQPHPYTQCHTEGPYYLNTPDQQGRKYRGGAMRLPHTSAKSSFTPTTWPSLLKPQPTMRARYTHRLAPVPPLRPKRPPIPLPPKYLHQKPFKTHPTNGRSRRGPINFCQ